MIRNALLTLTGLIFCVLAVFLLIAGEPEDRLMALGCLGFFGGCALIGAGLLRADLRKPKTPSASAQNVSFHFDRVFHLAFGVASWGMTAGAVIFALRAPIMWLAAGPALILFGLGGALLFARGFEGKSVLTINAAGVFDRRIMSSPAPWSVIEAAGFPLAGPVQQLQLIVNGAESFRRVRKGLFAWSGRGAVKGHRILIVLQGLDGTPAEVLAAIGAHKPGILILGDFDDDANSSENMPDKLEP